MILEKISPKDADKKVLIKINGILYATSNLLRLNVYKELSRPEGEVARWEKVFKRLEQGTVGRANHGFV